jgi:hypothetical protein
VLQHLVMLLYLPFIAVLLFCSVLRFLDSQLIKKYKLHAPMVSFRLSHLNYIYGAALEKN